MPSPACRPQARCFYSGTDEHPIYVDYLAPSAESGRPKVVMLHGGGHTGACYLATPDGRPGWADLFARAEFPVYVPDWPGHGRSPMRGVFSTLSSRDVVDALARLFEHIGPAVLLAHSAAGPIAWKLAERLPDLVSAVVGIAPGAPANLVPPPTGEQLASGHAFYSDEARPIWVENRAARAFWTNATRFPANLFNDYRKSIVSESARIMNERFNFDGLGLTIAPEMVRGRPILVVTGSMDPRHPREVDQATAEYLGGTFLWLPDHGIEGNGHMMMIEDNSDEIGRMIMRWIEQNAL